MDFEERWNEEYYEEYMQCTTVDSVIDDCLVKLEAIIKDKAKGNFKGILAEADYYKTQNEKLVESNAKLKSENVLLKKDAKSARFDELMKDRLMVMWKPSSENQGKQPKCDKCDDDRRIKFKSPTGKQMSEWCDCNKNIYKYEPRQVIASEFNLRSNYGSGELIVWYKSYEDDDDGMSFDGSGDACKVISDGKNFEELDKTYKVFFTTEEECQRFCDWKNAGE